MQRSPNRTHDRASFFKYTSFTTAAAVLAGGRLRWSSPAIFNDPFDVPAELTYNFTPQQVMKAALDRCVALIEHPPADSSRLTPKLQQIVEAVKAGMPSAKKLEVLDAFRAEVRAATPEGKGLQELLMMWRTMVPELRILCLCESPAHVAMWHHYADQYRGAVLEFDCSDELDSAWLGAARVEYDDAGNTLARLDTWANLLVLETTEAVKELTHLATHIKASDWKYENEWRLLSYRREADSALFTDYRFHPNELRGVYLGPKMNTTDATRLRELALGYPNAKVFCTEIGLGPRLTFSASDA